MLISPSLIPSRTWLRIYVCTLSHTLSRAALRTILGALLGASLASVAIADTVADDNANSVTNSTNAENSALTATTQQAVSLKIIQHLIAQSHYRNRALNDEFSGEIYELYLERLDPARSIFMRSDIDRFEALRNYFDDLIKRGNLKPVFVMFDLYRMRLQQRADFALMRLTQPFDFDRKENYVLDRAEAEWPADQSALDELWRKRIKNDILTLQLSDRDEEEVRDTLTRRYEQMARRARQFNGEDVFQIFANAYTNSIEPHTAYFSPHDGENFNIQMSLSLEGIGAELQSDEDYVKVRRVIAGGPADIAGELQSDDLIIGVAQGEEAMVDVVGWRLDEVVELIRGPKATIVRLEVLSDGPDGDSRVISIRRDTIKLEEQAAKKHIFEIKGGDGVSNSDSESADANASASANTSASTSTSTSATTSTNGQLRIGVIDLPSFYIDFNGMQNNLPDYRSTTRDVRKLLVEFQSENIDGLIIDLRGNGGGSLAEAVSLTGLFIEDGPVVQVQNSAGQVQINRDDDDEIVYHGPLAVLVDRHSASSSEIFAAAIQDYRRGLIIGEPTFGKGTVQHLVDLNRYDKNADGKLGQLKVTIAQFFRINGGSTQHRGVIPDILWQSVADDRSSERIHDNAIPWRQINATKHRLFREQPPQLVALRTLHEQRAATDPEIRHYNAVARLNDAWREQKSVSLNETVRTRERAQRNAERLSLENDKRRALGEPTVDSIDELDAENESAANDADDAGEDEYEPDAFLRESGKVLGDYLLSHQASPDGAITTQAAGAE